MAGRLLGVFDPCPEVPTARKQVYVEWLLDGGTFKRTYEVDEPVTLPPKR